MRRTIILAAAIAIILLGLWGTAVIYFDETRLKSMVSERLSEQLGRRVEIVGVLRFSVFPRPRVEARNVVIPGPDGSDRGAGLTARRVSMSVRVLPLLRGDVVPGEIHLSGAIADLGRLQPGDSDLNPLAGIRSGAKLLAGRSLKLDDVTLVLSRNQAGGLRAVTIDYIELDRFRLDRTMGFRFRGDLSDPPVLEDVRIDGLLHVPASSDAPLRLRDMRLEGRIAELDQPFSLSGELTAATDDSLRLAIAGAQLHLGEQLYDLSFNFYDGEMPSADLLVSGRKLDWLALEAATSRVLNAGLATTLAALSRRVDLRSQLQFRHIQVGPIDLSQSRIDLRSKPAGLGMDLAAMFPGGLVEASGVLTVSNPASLVLDASIAELSQLLESFDLPGVAGGTGEARLSLAWPGGGESGYLLEGQLELWDGYGRIASNGAEPLRRVFDQFHGEIRLSPGYLELPGFEFKGTDLAGTGWAAVEWPGGNLGGEIRSPGANGELLQLSGTLSRPQLTPLEAAAVEDSGPAAGDVDTEREGVPEVEEPGH